MVGLIYASAVIEHGQANHEYFLNNFDMAVVNKKRCDLYREVNKMIKK
jgi:hypothetical protein